MTRTARLLAALIIVTAINTPASPTALNQGVCDFMPWWPGCPPVTITH